MPGDHWERGLVPSALIEEGGGLIHEGRHAVIIDQPSPIEDLVAAARPFRAELMDEGLSDEDYIRAFLEPFGAQLGRAVLWEDPTGTRIPISQEFFRTRDGALKIGKRGRGIYAPWMAETIMDPDEMARNRNPVTGALSDLVLDRRYVRAGRYIDEDGQRHDAHFVSVLEIGRRWWEDTTVYPTTDRAGNTSSRLLHLRRGGKLLWKRK